MRGPWKTLGLDGPTKDLKAIKRAYAAKLKVTRPEEDPEGFMALRDALDAAKRYAGRQHPGTIDAQPTPPVTTTAPARDTENRPPTVISQASEDIPGGIANDGPTADHIMASVETVLKTPSEIHDAQAWLKALKDTAGLDIDEYDRLEYRLTDRLLVLYDYDNRMFAPKKRFAKKQRHIKPEAMKAIYRHMGWNKEIQRPERLQEPLTWLIYESGILKRPKDENIVIDTWQRDAVRTGWRVAVIIVLFTLCWLTDPLRGASPETHPMLPLTGETEYGRFETDRKAGTHNYIFDANRPEIKELVGYDKLTDNYEVQFSHGSTEKVTVRIGRNLPVKEDSSPDLTARHDPSRPEYSGPVTATLKTVQVSNDENLTMPHAISILSAALFSGWCFFFFLGLILKYVSLSFMLVLRLFADGFRRLIGRT